MGPGMFDGLGRAIGCLVLLVFVLGIAAGALGGSCAKSCRYRIEGQNDKD